MSKISINMLSVADVVKGHGVDTAYCELLHLLKKYGKKDLNIYENKGLNYDILHVHTVDPISFFKQRFTKNATVTHVHFLPSTLNGALKLPSVFSKIYEKWVKNIYLKSDYLVVVNPSYIKRMIELGFNKENIFYIPNIISTDSFYVIKDKDRLKRKYGYKKDDFIVVGVEQLHKGKGVLDFIKLARENKDINFLWVGGFNFGNVMEGYSEIKDVYDNPPSNLRFTGIVDRNEVNILCNISDVFFLPSYCESFALVVLEASRTLKPIILRDLDVYKEIYYDNVLYGKNNNDFINYIRKLKDDKKFYDECVIKAKKINRMYSEKKIYQKWLNLYKTIYNRVR